MIDRGRWLELIAVHWMHVPDDPRGFVHRGIQTNRPAAGDAVPFHVVRRTCRVLVELADAGDTVEGLNQRELGLEVHATQAAVGTALNVLASLGFIEIHRADKREFPRQPDSYKLTMPERCCERARRAA